MVLCGSFTSAAANVMLFQASLEKIEPTMATAIAVINTSDVSKLMVLGNAITVPISFLPKPITRPTNARPTTLIIFVDVNMF